MKSIFKKYLWLFEFIGAAIIIAVGIVSKTVPDILVMIIGIIFLIMGLFRLIPLIKTTDNKKLKIIYFLEILIDIVAGIVLVYLSISEKSNDLNKLFGYIIGGILYIRALVYFVAIGFYNEKNDFVKFVIHIILITISSIIIGRGGFNVDTLGWIILIFSILCFATISFSGYSHYRKYRSEIAAKRIMEKVEVAEKDKAITSEEIINEKQEEKEAPSINA